MIIPSKLPPLQMPVLLQIKRSTPLRKLMDAYCKKQGINRTSVRFHFDGRRIEDEKTAEDVCDCFCDASVSSSHQRLYAIHHVSRVCSMKWRMMM